MTRDADQYTQRALWVVSGSGLAGVGRHVLDVAASGIPDWDLVFAVPEGPLADRLTALGAYVISKGFGQELGTVRSLRALRNAEMTIRPHVIHSHLAWADLLVAALPTKAARISTEHGIAGQRLLYHPTVIHASAKEALHRVRLRRTAALIAVSRATKATIRTRWGVPRQLLITVIPNGVDHRPHALPRTWPGFRFGYLGRLEPEKNLPGLLDAFELLHRDFPEATLEIAGIGMARDAVATDVWRRPCRHAVSFTGEVSPADFFSRVDVVVQLSQWENCSYTLLDALAWGKGVVATDVGGNSEFLPGHCLVPLGDQEAAAACLHLQATQPAQAPRLPDCWPTVEDMVTRIGAVYDTAAATQLERSPVS